LLVVECDRMRLGCGWMHNCVVIKTIHGAAIRAGNQVTVRVDGDLNRRVSELLLDVDDRLPLLQ
jgi:hypothetical protein